MTSKSQWREISAQINSACDAPSVKQASARNPYLGLRKIAGLEKEGAIVSGTIAGLFALWAAVSAAKSGKKSFDAFRAGDKKKGLLHGGAALGEALFAIPGIGWLGRGGKLLSGAMKGTRAAHKATKAMQAARAAGQTGKAIRGAAGIYGRTGAKYLEKGFRNKMMRNTLGRIPMGGAKRVHSISGKLESIPHIPRKLWGKTRLGQTRVGKFLGPEMALGMPLAMMGPGPESASPRRPYRSRLPRSYAPSPYNMGYRPPQGPYGGWKG